MNKTEMKRKIINNRFWVEMICVCILALIIGVAGELIYNMAFEKQDDYTYISLDNIKTENFELQNGNTYVSAGGPASLTIEFPEQYVDKFFYRYTSGLNVDCNLIVHTKNGDQRNTKVIQDSNNIELQTSTTNIRCVADGITMEFGAGSPAVNIYDIAINNTGNYSMYRLIFLTLCAFFILSGIVIWKNGMSIKLEVIFLTIALSVGSLSIFAMPSHKVGMDEEIHFGRAYFFAETIAGQETITLPNGVHELISVSLSNWPYHLHQSEEEMKEENAQRNISADYHSDNSEIVWVEEENYSFNLYTFCYVFQWLMIKIGMVLSLPFVAVYRMGRLGNLLLYCAVVYFAIRHLKHGKRIIFILSLMPTSMMSAMTYGYDAWVNGFSFLGASYLLEEWFGDKEKVEYKNWIIFILAILLASVPKAVYSPFLLLAVMIPARKFRSKKEMLIMKSIASAAGILMVGTFMLPAVMSPQKMGGDTRGGDTSVARQLSFIFSYPVTYAKLLVNSIKDTFFSFSIGAEGLGRMAHLVKMASEPLLILTVGYTVATESKAKDTMKVQMKERVSILILCFGVICFIWTALYLSYTPVGLNVINGVQGRYYLPVTIWILWALRSNHIRYYRKNSADYTILAGLALLVLLPAVYGAIIVNTF